MKSLAKLILTTIMLMVVLVLLMLPITHALWSSTDLALPPYLPPFLPPSTIPHTSSRFLPSLPSTLLFSPPFLTLYLLNIRNEKVEKKKKKKKKITHECLRRVS